MEVVPNELCRWTPGLFHWEIKAIALNTIPCQSEASDQLFLWHQIRAYAFSWIVTSSSETESKDPKRTLGNLNFSGNRGPAAEILLPYALFSTDDEPSSNDNGWNDGTGHKVQRLVWQSGVIALRFGRRRDASDCSDCHDLRVRTLPLTLQGRVTLNRPLGKQGRHPTGFIIPSDLEGVTTAGWQVGLRTVLETWPTKAGIEFNVSLPSAWTASGEASNVPWLVGFASST
jgi:hypothetical protein